MSMASLRADGVAPPGVDFRVSRSTRHEIVVAVQLTVAAAAAVALAVLPQTPAAVKAPVVAAARAVRPLIPPEGLAGPSVAFAPRLDSRAVLQALLKQAGLRPTLDPRRLSWDQARKLNALMPAASAADAAQPFRLDIHSRNGRQALRCLTQAAYYEAGANGPEAEAAVVQVVLNRVRHPDFPKSVCGVVYQGSERDTGCQFTFTCDGALARPLDMTAWNEAAKVAARALSGYVVKAVGASTYYHADYVFPTWAPTLQKIATVGPHIFYRMIGSEGAAQLLTGRYAGGELKLAKAMLRATDRFIRKPEREDEPKVILAQAQTPAPAHDPAAPAGLKTQADRIQRVHEMMAAQMPPPAPAKVETASIEPTVQAGIQATLQAASPPQPVVAPPAPAPASPSEAPAV